LNLRSNKLEEFTFQLLLNLKRLKFLYLSNNPILNIPIELYNKNQDVYQDIKNYLESSEKDKEKIFIQEAKMILIGNGEVGKTSIRLKLLNRNAILPLKAERTQGIDIETYKVKNLEKEKTGLVTEIDFQLHIWDFGGQGKYREVQQLFCSRKSLYLFVTSFDDNPDNEDYVGFDYWLSMANAFNYDEIAKKHSPVIHVVNKIDQKLLPINEEERYKLFSNIYPDFIKISCLNLLNFDLLEKAIRDVLPLVSEDIFRTPFPQAWLNVKEKLQKISKNHIIFADYISICTSEGVDKSNAITLINVLDRMGYVIYYGRNPLLKDWIILNPLWVKNAIYQVIDSDIFNGAERYPKQLESIWETYQTFEYKRNLINEALTFKNYTDEEHKKLISLMLAYEFCYEQEDQYGDIFYIIPALLNPIRPLVPKFLESFDYELKFTYDPFIPAGTLNKLIVRLHEHIYKDLKWKNGVILHDAQNNAYAEITEKWEEKTVYLKLKKGNNVQPLYELIFKTFKDLNEHLKETKFLARLEFFTSFKNQNEWYKPSQIKSLIKAKDFAFIEQVESIYNQNNNPKPPNPSMPTLNFNKDENYKDLVKAIKEKKVVLFAGTGVSAYTTNGDPLSMWKGLLIDGIEYCQKCSIAGCDDEWVEDKKRALNRNKLSECLSVAQSITEELTYNKHFKTWLDKSVGSLTIQKPDLIESIKELNCPVFTTNYDNLLEVGLDRKPIHNLQPNKIQELLNNERAGVVYLHGYYDDPETVILGIRSYEQLANKAFFQALQQAITLTKHILFVGYGSGLDDPNFGKLIAWSQQNIDSEHHHYRLISEEDKYEEVWDEKEKKLVKKENQNIISKDKKIQNIVYGETHKKIAAFFEELNKDVNTP
jgi:GTPase SAR1 family protein